MQYKFYFYNGVPTQERRAKETPDDGLIIETVSIDSDDAAILYAADYISDMNDHDMEFDSSVEAEDYLNDLDTSSGEAFCVAIESEDGYIYGEEDIVKYFTEGAIDDDTLTEAIIDNPKVTEFTNLKTAIADLEKEIKQIKSETSKAASYMTSSSKVLAFLSDADKALYDEIKSKISAIQNEVKELKAKYQSEKTSWYRTGPDGDDVDFDTVVTVHDAKLKTELEPKVKELQKELIVLDDQIDELEQKAKAAYDTDADTRRASSGYADKVAQLDALKLSKEELLKEISSDPSFLEVFAFIQTGYSNAKTIDVGVSDEGVFIDVEVRFDIELEDEDFDEDGYLDLNDIEEDAAEDICDELGLGDYFECEESDAEFYLELDELYTEGDPTVHRSFTPGRMWLSNGDPGYPDEYDAEVDGELEAIVRIRVTRVK